MLFSLPSFRTPVSHQIQRHLLSSLPAKRAIQRCASWRSHITYWRNGGQTAAASMALLCRIHHRLVHDRDYIITRGKDGWIFTAPNGGMALPPAGQLPETDRDISDLHDAGITPATITPPHSGERLDLNLAI